MKKDTKPQDSKFSRFFREASVSEQERLISEVVRKSTEDQKALIDRYKQIKTSYKDLSSSRRKESTRKVLAVLILIEPCTLDVK